MSLPRIQSPAAVDHMHRSAIRQQINLYYTYRRRDEMATCTVGDELGSCCHALFRAAAADCAS